MRFGTPWVRVLNLNIAVLNSAIWVQHASVAALNSKREVANGTIGAAAPIPTFAHVLANASHNER